MVGMASRDEPLDAILASAAEMAGHGIAYIGSDGDVASVRGASESFAERIRFHPLRELRRLFLVVDVDEGLDETGHLVFDEAPESKDDFVSPIKLALQVFHVAKGTDTNKIQKFAENFLQRLPGGIDENVLKNDLSAMNVGFDSGIQVVAGEVDSNSEGFDREKDEKFLSRLDSRLRHFSGDYISSVKQCRFISVVSPALSYDLASLTKNIAEICTHVAMRHYGEKIPAHVYIAFSSARQNPLDMAACGREAFIALNISLANRFERLIAKWDDLGALKLIGKIASGDDAVSFCKETLKNLIFNDRGMKELLYTLIILEKNNWNFREAARKMFYHHNTIKHRCEKIQEIIGADLSDSETRFNVSLALRVFQAMPDGFF
jgi:hypothetical protein